MVVTRAVVQGWLDEYSENPHGTVEQFLRLKLGNSADTTTVVHEGERTLLDSIILDLESYDAPTLRKE
jgi:hypothetical protein